MAYSTIADSTSENVLTVLNEKEFLINEIFNGDITKFNSVNNNFSKIYENSDSLIPLTSIIYTPNRKFFEKSKFYKQINNNKILNWLKKHNILVLIYGITSNLDYSVQSRDNYSDSMLLMDIIQTNGNLSNRSVPSIFENEYNIPDTNYDMINLIRFENSAFNYRLNTINDRIKNVYSSNFSKINYLIFTDLNNEFFISNFMKNTINTLLN